MFSFFKKKSAPAHVAIAPSVEDQAQSLFLKLRPFWKDVNEVVEHLDGPFKRLHESGLFVGIVALLELIKTRGPDTLGSEFMLYWLVYVNGNPNQLDAPSVDQLNVLFGDRGDEYSPLLNALSDPPTDPAKSPQVQLVWALFANCTGKPAPSQFLKIMTAAPVLAEIVGEIEEAARAA